MLIEFSVSNFQSIAEQQTLSMLPAKGSSYLLETGNPYYPNVLRIGGLFGANGSGKTSFLNAIQTFQNIVVNSAKYTAGDKIPVTPFKLDESLRGSPTSFEIIFKGLVSSDVWRYGITLDGERVHKEWLYQRTADTGRERKTFVRNGQTISATKSLGLSKALLERVTGKNQLLLSKLEQFSGEDEIPAMVWIKLFLRPVLSSSNWFQSVTGRKLLTEQHSSQITELLKSIGMNFESIRLKERSVVENSPEETAIMTGDKHIYSHSSGGMAYYLELEFERRDRSGSSQPIYFHEESLGTRALFGIAGILVDVIRMGMTIVVDELNQSFHPEFLRLIVELFRSPEANFDSAQLIFSAHDTSVMSILERDELWITEKQPDGATHLYSLAELGTAKAGGPRRRGVFGKHYLENKYGGLPEIDLIRAVKAMKSLESSDAQEA
ncbi:AAA family ATPase [Devosia rhizoryzae]|uniref:ATP-binding protein n=1 Tax=Devosia rhizoryzae TaxID=2774137 RepID=A0ABX7CD78_9HYPH|nr:ATP-binding protein [Devosia rhizoryzae]QQR39911.1 ATP-binding protein [Devosia rhizoryzae]